MTSLLQTLPDNWACCLANFVTCSLRYRKSVTMGGIRGQCWVHSGQLWLSCQNS